MKGLLPNLFDRIEVATQQGIPVVMVGQGVDLMEDPEILTRARQVLPKVDLICYRNRCLGKPLLDSLNVPPQRMIMTGDDAVEMAYLARPNTLGSYIGISLRVAVYTQVANRHIQMLRPVVHEAAEKRKTKLLSVPISSAPQESDITYIQHILAGYGRTSTGWRKFETSMNSIKRVGQCRLMITGTYHGAVFALAQGIPVIGVAGTQHYFNKLSELADEFTLGCQVLHLEDKDFPEKLAAAIDNAWSSAEQNRPELLKVAARQIELGHGAYKRICEIVESRKEKAIEKP